MVLPTNCDEAPRFVTNLQPRLCKWASAASTVWAMGSIPAASTRTAPLTPGSVDEFKCQCSCLSVRMDGVLLAEAQNSWLPSPHMLLYLPGLVCTRQILRPSWVPEYVNNTCGRLNEGLLPAVQTVQMVLNNRTNRSQSDLSLYFRTKVSTKQRIKSWIQIIH